MRLKSEMYGDVVEYPSVLGRPPAPQNMSQAPTYHPNPNPRVGRWGFLAFTGTPQNEPSTDTLTLT